MSTKELWLLIVGFIAFCFSVFALCLLATEAIRHQEGQIVLIQELDGVKSYKMRMGLGWKYFVVHGNKATEIE